MHLLLNKILSGELMPIGWGNGEIFKLRKFIHDFEVEFTIHTNPQDTEGGAVNIYSPDILKKLDLSKYILIAYTVDYIDEIIRYCKIYPELIVLPFNAGELGVAKNLAYLKKAYETFCDKGVSYGSLSNYMIDLGN